MFTHILPPPILGSGLPPSPVLRMPKTQPRQPGGQGGGKSSAWGHVTDWINGGSLPSVPDADTALTAILLAGGAAMAFHKVRDVIRTQQANRQRQEIQAALDKFHASAMAGPVQLGHKPTLLLTAGVDQPRVMASEVMDQTASGRFASFAAAIKGKVLGATQAVKDKMAGWVQSFTTLMATRFPKALEILRKIKSYGMAQGARISKVASVGLGLILSLVAGGVVSGKSAIQMATEIAKSTIAVYVGQVASDAALVKAGLNVKASATMSLIKWGFVAGLTVAVAVSMPWIILGVSVLGAVATVMFKRLNPSQEQSMINVLARLAAQTGTLVIKTAAYAGARVAAAVKALISSYHSKRVAGVV